jgi:hypothetical protein
MLGMSHIFAEQTQPTETRLRGCGGSHVRAGLWLRIPCKRGKSREFSGERADFMKTGAQSCNNFNALELDFPTKAIREFFRC